MSRGKDTKQKALNQRNKVIEEGFTLSFFNAQ